MDYLTYTQLYFIRVDQWSTFLCCSNFPGVCGIINTRAQTFVNSSKKSLDSAYFPIPINNCREAVSVALERLKAISY